MPKIKSVTDNTLKSPVFDDIKAWYEAKLAPAVLDFTDPKPYEIYAQARWAGIFQLTSQGAQKLFVKAKPQSIIDIATLTSIYRPGPLAANVDKLYLDAKNDGNMMEWGDQRINEILKKTYSCLAGGSLVRTSKGEMPIREIVERNMVGTKLPSYNESSGEIEEDEIVAVASNGVRDIIELEMGDGTVLRLTDDHLVMTQRGWVSAGKLMQTDEVFSLKLNTSIHLSVPT